MPDNEPRDVVPSQGGVFQDLALRVKLILRLMGDSRVSPLLKLIPVGTLVYLLFPDIPGPIDDAAIIWLGLYVFVEMCPPEIVEEHMRLLTGTVQGEWQEVPPKRPPEEDVVEGQFRDE